MLLDLTYRLYCNKIGSLVRDGSHSWLQCSQTINVGTRAYEVSYLFILKPSVADQDSCVVLHLWSLILHSMYHVSLPFCKQRMGEHL